MPATSPPGMGNLGLRMPPIPVGRSSTGSPRTKRQSHGFAELARTGTRTCWSVMVGLGTACNRRTSSGAPYSVWTIARMGPPVDSEKPMRLAVTTAGLRGSPQPCGVAPVRVSDEGQTAHELEESLVSAVPDLLLNNGRTIPQFGFGVFQIKPDQTVAATSAALDAGYRHIDTAEMYGNEKEVGEAVARSAVNRGEVFITSKLNNGFHRPDDARREFDNTLAALGSDYVDLFLIHWPLPTRYGGDYVSAWKALEEFYHDGRARSIGVSNFQPHHLRRLHEECEITPAVNQIEVHPYLTQDEVRQFC